MFKHAFCFIIVVGFFFGPYSPKVYNLFEADIHYRDKCLDYLRNAKPPYHPNIFWADYRKYVTAEIDLERGIGKNWEIESPNDLNKEAMEEKKEWGEFEAELKEARQKNWVLK